MAETEAERKKKDDLIRETIMAKLIETGEKDKLKGKTKLPSHSLG